MLSNYDLEEMAIDHKISNFQVISKDELDNMTFKTNQNFIINMENEHDEYGNFNCGTHWVGLYISQDKDTIYFDSFGFQPPQSVLKYCRKSKKRICYSTRSIQNIRSSICGLYCLGFLCWMNNKPFNGNYIDWFESFVDSYNDDVTKNDTILKKILKKY